MKSPLYQMILLSCMLTINIAYAQPTNDDLTNATNISNLPFTDTILSADAMAATVETNENICNNDEAWWYSFTPTVTGTYLVTAEVSGSTNNDDENEIRLGYYTGTVHPLTEVGCFDNDNGLGWGEEEYLNLVSGTIYYFRVAAGDVSKILDVTFIVRAVNNWTGNVDSDWSITGNWELGTVPTADEVALLGTCTNEPIIMNATNAVANRVVLSGADLDINQGGDLSISNTNSSAIYINDVGSVLTINGSLNIANVGDLGVFCDLGVVNVSSTATVNIDNAFIGMLFQSDSTHTIDGTVTIQDSKGGVFIIDTDSVLVGSSAVMTINNMQNDGFLIDATNAYLQVNGTVDIDNATVGLYVDEGIIEVNGTLDIATMSGAGIDFNGSSGCELYVNSGGILNIDDIDNYGMLDVVGSNAGTITITSTGNDALNTGTSTFTNTGTISISGSGKDGIDCSADFNNSGTVEIQGISEFALNDPTFNNLSGGTLSTDCSVEAANATFASGSIIAPGVNIGCMTFDSDEDFSGTIINIEINNTTQCTGHDYILVTGNLTLTGATLNLSGSHSPTIGDEITIIELSLFGFITGTFNGLNEGDVIIFNGFQWSITYMGGDGNDIVLTNVALPVELLSFEGEIVEEGVLLSWQTATEVNNDYFDIEWSIDGINFEKIGRVEGVGTTLEKQSYAFLHDLNQQGLHYYRLKQVDLDGIFEYSKIINFDIQTIEQSMVQTIKIYPNPTTDFINIETTTIGEIVQLIDNQGEILQEYQLQKTNTQYSVAHLPKGIYYVKLGTTTKKIFILK